MAIINGIEIRWEQDLAGRMIAFCVKDGEIVANVCANDLVRKYFLDYFAQKPRTKTEVPNSSQG